MRIGVVKSAEPDTEHGYAERKKDTEKHQGTAWLRIDLVLVKKVLKLFSIEIRQDLIASHKSRHVGLSRKLLHLLVRLPVFAHVDLLEAIALLAEIILRVNTPGTPFAAVEL